MSKVHDVDPKLIRARSSGWPGSSRRMGAGSPTRHFINEGATNRYNSDVLRITAYIAWSLENTGYQGPAVEKARQYVQKHMNGEDRTSTRWRCWRTSPSIMERIASSPGRRCSFCSTRAPRRTTRRGGRRRKRASTEAGASAAVETTGLAVQALLKWGAGVGRRREKR